MAAFILALATGRQGTFLHTFEYSADRDLTSVSVAGTFNGWSPTANPMTATGRVWRLTLSLPKGKVQYKFVLNGKDWIVDPKGKSVDDGNGNLNSELTVLPDDFNVPASPNDGVISESALRHNQNPPYFSFDRGKLTIGLQVRTGDLSSVSVRLNGRTYPMELHSSDPWFALYRVRLPWDGKTDLAYAFELRDGNVVKAFGPKGLEDTDADNTFALKAADFHNIVVPSWPEHSVIYQIFPDRFENGDRSNDSKNVVPWTSKPTYDNHFGGDFAGVVKHLSYLESLGVHAVYFNPIFVSKDNHRYATGDYMHVDPELGTDQEFKRMTRLLKKHGIGTILDGVFNHTATYFWAFQDVVKNGAASKYKDWYFFKSFPVVLNGPPNYEAWFGFGAMPKLNTATPATRNYLLNVPKYWDSVADIAGWRLDVPNEIPSDYWVDFRKVVKSGDPQRWIVGEIWGNGSPWLQGNQFDSVMGYQFRSATVSFLGTKSIGPKEYADQLMAVYDSYAPQVSRNLMNLLGSHDTERFLTVCKGDKNLALLGADVQLTWPGAPSVYYGDELGMEGGRDPMNRGVMRWDEISNNPMLKHYKNLIHARNSTPALQTGDPVVLLADDANEILAFARVLGDEVAITVVNRSKQDRSVLLPLQGMVPLSGSMKSNGFLNALDGARVHLSPSGSIAISLPPETSAVLIPAPAIVSSSRVRAAASATRPVLASAS